MTTLETDHIVRPIPTTNEPSRRAAIERKLRIINLFTVIVPFLGLAAAIALLWGVAFHWIYPVMLGCMIVLTSLGVTVGFHRLCTHKSFTSPAWVRYIFAAAGSMAVQGPVIWWCAEHRRHHQHSDTEHDPHSPHMGLDGSWGEGLIATIRGAFHAHMGWLLSAKTQNLSKYTKDLRQDKVVVTVSKQFVPWVVIGFAIPAIVGALVTWSWMGLLLGFLWGGLVRVLLVHHLTWSVNSVCHLWGSRPFSSRDESRNNPIVGVLGFGEGWHNNHHAFPTSARHGLFWWQLDISYMVIRGLQFVGLARDVRVPDRARIQAKRRKNPQSHLATPLDDAD